MPRAPSTASGNPSAAAMRRVMVVGGPGSGKTTFAGELGAATGLPVVHMDRIHWLPGWIERSRDEKDRLASEVHARPAWIFEGGHSRTYPERLARADTMIWLDVPVALRLLRVLRRAARWYGTTRPDLPENCPERFDLGFLAFILRSRRRSRARLAAIAADPPPHLAVYHLRGVRDTRRFLASLASVRAQDDAAR